jgi:hypothetical protein
LYPKDFKVFISFYSYTLLRGEFFLSDSWIERSKKILEYIKKLEDTKGKDRLDYVRSIRFMLGAFEGSLKGWIFWINNPDIMTKFTLEEIEEMNRKLTGFIRSFIEYDLEITQKGIDKGLLAKRKIPKRRRIAEEIYI